MKTRAESKILVVEDEIPMARAIIDRLKSEEFQVTHASNGEEGLKTASKNSFDVIILDLSMPKVGGMEMMHKLRENFEDKIIPIIIYTNLVPDEEILEGVSKDRPTFYLSKTSHSIDYLIETIDKIIAGI